VGFLRAVEPLNCTNLDQALRIVQHPNASNRDRLLAGGYVTAFAGSHAAVLIGAGILTWEAALGGSGAITAISQWGSAHMVAGTTLGQTLTVGSTAAAIGGMGYTVFQAAQGDPHAQTLLANPAVYGAATLWNDLAEAGVAAFCRMASPHRLASPGTALLGPKPQLLTAEDWGAWGSSPYVGDMKLLAQSRTVREALSRIPRSWSVESQAVGEGWIFKNPDPSAIVTEVRIKAPMAEYNPMGQYYYAQLRLGKRIEGHPWADPWGIVYYDRDLNLVNTSDAGRNLSHIPIYYNRTYRPN
jgi:hypothetical protein